MLAAVGGGATASRPILEECDTVCIAGNRGSAAAACETGHVAHNYKIQPERLPVKGL